ncbi:hypothetical protein FAM21838_00603 [Lentilactobacillus parabuchneri]|uniref:nucleotidyl transferase AbiEii/AbiGii toxin family protein n=1 Tax=Lentilactobacillus parabuchneri TaxID=152331 RepID=UPI000A0F9753|nr:nucleotidyl transferase AbiEii/AbiGii toxin family protein [Lentilactobacillus parabuchneri]ORN13094.1 hypothetical protein FAM21838_00603 [Lentilactobacillus parabuchneri]
MNDKELRDRLRDQLKNIHAQTGINTTSLQRKYFIDGFLSLLATSKYQSHFIWKGGMVLSAVTGVHERTTIDLDTMVEGVSIESENLKKMFNEIIAERDYHGVRYQLIDIQPIQEEKEYVGQRVRFQASLAKIKDSFHLDVATGEVLIPSEVNYAYKPLLGTETINLLIYRPERMLAEKLQTVLSRRSANTRMKDFYDIYILMTTEIIDFKILQTAWTRVLLERESQAEWEEWHSITTQIRKSVRMKSLWQGYAKKHAFAENISFESTVAAINNCLSKLQ